MVIKPLTCFATSDKIMFVCRLIYALCSAIMAALLLPVGTVFLRSE